MVDNTSFLNDRNDSITDIPINIKIYRIRQLLFHINNSIHKTNTFCIKSVIKIYFIE